MLLPARLLVFLLAIVVLAAGLVKVSPTASAAGTPTLTVAGVALAGSTQPATSTADLTDAPAATGEVTWLVDDKFAAKTPTAPHSFAKTYAAGAHKLKARWVIDPATGATAETFANFTVGSAPAEPTLLSGSEPLQGATVNSPFRADLAGVPTSIAGGVTFFLDGAQVVKDTSSPFQANITTSAGSHQIKATWTDPANQQARQLIATATVQDGPFLTSAGTPLHAGKVTSPFTAVLSNPVGVTGDVTWLLDDSFIGKSTAPPHQFTVTTSNGQHKLKARWVVNTGTGATKDVTAVFTVGMMPEFRLAPPVDEEPGHGERRYACPSETQRAMDYHHVRDTSELAVIMIPTHAMTVNGDFSLDFILRRPTVSEEISQLLERMDGAEIFAASLWALPAGKRLDEVDLAAWPKEYIQCAGTADRLTVEVRRLESGHPQQFVVGRAIESGSVLKEVNWNSGKHSVQIQPNEILNWREATDLFVDYYAERSLAEGFRFREIAVG